MNIQLFVKKLNKEIRHNLKSGFLKNEYFTTWNHNKQSEAHSRVFGIIVKVCHEMDFQIEIEKSFNYTNEQGKKFRFKPDLAIYKNSKLIGIIEYESTNSSDARFNDYSKPTCDLRNIEGLSNSHFQSQPYCWIIISTLPYEGVCKENWGAHGCSRGSAKFRKILRSPFDYYFPKYIKKTREMIARAKPTSKIFLLNLNNNRLSVEEKFESGVR